MRINRIRLEFKDVRPDVRTWVVQVLIESDWNLKSVVTDGMVPVSVVLIESDWNLKFTVRSS